VARFCGQQYKILRRYDAGIVTDRQTFGNFDLFYRSPSVHITKRQFSTEFPWATRSTTNWASFCTKL